MIKRYAIVRGARDDNEVAAYLPANYSVIGTAVEGENVFFSTSGSRFMNERPVYVIGGFDDSGWTLDGYLKPRLASGMMSCEEIDLSHPIMKVIP